MDLSGAFARTTMYALAGAVAGLLLGLLLVAVDAIENPFWVMSAGIMVGAVFAPTLGSGRGSRT